MSVPGPPTAASNAVAIPPPTVPEPTAAQSSPGPMAAATPPPATPKPTTPVPAPAGTPPTPSPAPAAPKPAAQPQPPPFPSSPLTEKFEAEFKAGIVERTVQTNKPMYVVQPAELARMLRFSHDTLKFEHLACISGIDLPPDTIEVVYNLYSYEHRAHLALKVKLQRATPEVDSATAIWTGADWPEREIYDLLGVTFKGHPHLKRILLPEGWQGHPLRKDYDRSKEQFINIAPDGEDLVTTDPSKGW